MNAESVSTFRTLRLPERAKLAGYAALIDLYDLRVPVPRRLWGICLHHRQVEEGRWRLLGIRYDYNRNLFNELRFALKREGVDLAVLCALFKEIDAEQIVEIVQEQPTSAYARRIWFLYEWLTGTEIEALEPAAGGAYVPVIDPELQFAATGETSTRHRLVDNLPGTRRFCPLVFRTPRLEGFLDANLAEEARKVIATVPGDLVARTAAFLLLKDSKSSFIIEGERPPHSRVQRWGRAIGEAGVQQLDVDELLRLQKVVIGDRRFVKLGLRDEGGFVGEHSRDGGYPLPVHISARHQDLEDLVAGLVAFARGAADDLDPVIAAAILAFGFIYIHPFQDGNGRIHRYLLHHILSKRGYNPPGFIFPISAAILDRIGDYRAVLESYSERLLPLIDWEPTDRNNVRVLNDTADYYRFFDVTPHAEFLFECVEQSIRHDLPEEAEFLRRYDAFAAYLAELVDMPDRTADLLFRCLEQNNGRLSKSKRADYFEALTDRETSLLEDRYRELFQAE